MTNNIVSVDTNFRYFSVTLEKLFDDTYILENRSVNWSTWKVYFLSPVPHYDLRHPVPHYDIRHPVPHYDICHPVPHYDLRHPVPHYDIRHPVPHYDLSHPVPHYDLHHPVPHYHLRHRVYIWCNSWQPWKFNRLKNF